MGMCGICWFDGRALTDEIYDLRKRVEEAEAKLRIHHEIHHEAVQREGGQNPVVTPTKPPAYKYPETFCSQCGGEFGPGNEGFSQTENSLRYIDRPNRARADEVRSFRNTTKE